MVVILTPVYKSTHELAYQVSPGFVNSGMQTSPGLRLYEVTAENRSGRAGLRGQSFL